MTAPTTQAVQSDEQELLWGQLHDITTEQRPKFEAWALSTVHDEDELGRFMERRPDGEYSMLTARAGFAAWLGGVMTERQGKGNFLAAISSHEAEVGRLRGELMAILKKPWPVTSGMSNFHDNRALEIFIADLKHMARAVLGNQGETN